MPYIGKEPVAGNFVLLDSITTSATATYALTKDSVAYSPESARNMLVSLNGVTQAPETAFTVSGSNITFSSALTSSDVIDYILVLGDVLSIGTPSDGTVGTSQMSYPLGNFSSTGIDDNADAVAITINSDEEVGVGATNPQKALHVVGGVLAASGDGSTSGITIDSTATAGYASTITHTDTGIEFDTGSTARDFTFDVSGSELMRIDTSSGNVGIGTTSVSYQLDVNSGADEEVARFQTTAGFADIFLQDTDTTAGQVRIRCDNNSLSFITNTNVRQTIDSSGNVGIGTTSPAYRLDVQDASDPAQIRLKEDGNTNGFIFKNFNGNEAQLVNADNGPMVFKTNDTERMRIDSSGQVIILGNGGTTTNSLDLTYNGSSGQANIQADSSGGSTLLTFGTSSSGSVSERMRIESGGNVGIGTTDIAARLSVRSAASASITNVLDVGNAQNAAGTGHGAMIRLHCTTDENRGVAIASSSSTNYATDNNMLFYTSTSSTLTERMRIDSSGNLMVAKTAVNGQTLGPELRANGQINAASAGDFLNMYSTTGSAYRFYVTNAGTINATNTSIQAISDESLKENIRDLDKGLETINALQPRRFDWKNGDGTDIMGFVAQEVEDVLPELVHEYKYTDEETKLALKMGDMIPSMVKAIQELSAQVNKLKAEVAALKGE